MKYFTLYWLDGKREIISCKNNEGIETAFSNAGYGAGALPSIDWYENDITNSAVWDKDKKQWEEKLKECPFLLEDFLKIPEAEILKIFQNKTNNIIVILPNKDLISLERSIHGTSSGVFEKLELQRLEYNEGPYDGEGDAECHYMAADVYYYPIEEEANAVKDLIKKCNEDPVVPTFSFTDIIEEAMKANRFYRTEY